MEMGQGSAREAGAWEWATWDVCRGMWWVERAEEAEGANESRLVEGRLDRLIDRRKEWDRKRERESERA